MPRRQKPEVKWYRIIYRGLHAAALLGEGCLLRFRFRSDLSGPRIDSSRPQNGFVFGSSQSTAKTCDRQGYRCPFEWCPPTTVRPAGELISIRGNSAAACTGTSPRQDWVAIPQAPTVVCLIASTGSHRRRSPTPMPLRVRSTHPPENPLGSGRDVDQNPISDAREREAVGLIHPSSNGTGMAI